MKHLLALALVFVGIPAALAQCHCAPCLCKDCSCASLTYAQAYDLALRQVKPLVVFVNVKTAPVPEAVCCEVKTIGFQTTANPGVIVSVPDRGDLIITAEIYGPASAEKIRSFCVRLPRQSVPTYNPTFARSHQGRGCSGGG